MFDEREIPETEGNKWATKKADDKANKGKVDTQKRIFIHELLIKANSIDFVMHGKPKKQHCVTELDDFAIVLNSQNTYKTKAPIVCKQMLTYTGPNI